MNRTPVYCVLFRHDSHILTHKWLLVHCRKNSWVPSTMPENLSHRRCSSSYFHECVDIKTKAITIHCWICWAVYWGIEVTGNWAVLSTQENVVMKSCYTAMVAQHATICRCSPTSLIWVRIQNFQLTDSEARSIPTGRNLFPLGSLPQRKASPLAALPALASLG